MRIERAEAGQLDGVRAIAASYGNLDEWPGRPDPLDFELRAGALWVAHEAGAVAGFAGVVRHGEVAHLADLFVARERLGEGIGRRLLDAALPPQGVRITFASGDERALPLYVRAGLRPLAPLLYLEGSRAAEAPGSRAWRSRGRGPRRGRERARAAGAARVPRRGRRLRARRRARGRLRDRPAAPAGAWLGPAAGEPAELLAFVGAVSAAHGSAKLALGGPNPALEPLLAAGFRLLGTDTYMASHPGALDIAGYLPEVDLG